VIVADSAGTLARRARAQPPLPRAPSCRPLACEPAPPGRTSPPSVRPNHRTGEKSAPSPARSPPRSRRLTGPGFNARRPRVRHHYPRDGARRALVNVLANPGCRQHRERSGSAYSRAENSHVYRLYAVHNDAVVYPYLRCAVPCATRTTATCGPDRGRCGPRLASLRPAAPCVRLQRFESTSSASPA